MPIIRISNNESWKKFVGAVVDLNDTPQQMESNEATTRRYFEESPCLKRIHLKTVTHLDFSPGLNSVTFAVVKLLLAKLENVEAISGHHLMLARPGHFNPGSYSKDLYTITFPNSKHLKSFTFMAVSDLVFGFDVSKLERFHLPKISSIKGDLSIDPLNSLSSFMEKLCFSDSIRILKLQGYDVNRYGKFTIKGMRNLEVLSVTFKSLDESNMFEGFEGKRLSTLDVHYQSLSPSYGVQRSMEDLLPNWKVFPKTLKHLTMDHHPITPPHRSKVLGRGFGDYLIEAKVESLHLWNDAMDRTLPLADSFSELKKLMLAPLTLSTPPTADLMGSLGKLTNLTSLSFLVTDAQNSSVLLLALSKLVKLRKFSLETDTKYGVRYSVEDSYVFPIKDVLRALPNRGCMKALTLKMIPMHFDDEFGTLLKEFSPMMDSLLLDTELAADSITPEFMHSLISFTQLTNLTLNCSYYLPQHSRGVDSTLFIEVLSKLTKLDILTSFNVTEGDRAALKKSCSQIDTIWFVPLRQQ